LYNKKVIKNKYVVLDSKLDINSKKIEEEILSAENDQQNLLLDQQVNHILMETEEKAKEIISQANKRSEEIIKKANQQSIAIVEEGKKQADLYYKQNVEQKSREFSVIIENAKKSLYEYTANYEKLLEDSLIEAFKKLNLKFLKQEILENPAWMKTIISELKNRLSSFNSFSMRMNERTFENAKEFLGESSVKSIKTDNSLSDNEIFVDTEYGVFDVSAQSYIEDMMKIFEESKNETK